MIVSRVLALAAALFAVTACGTTSSTSRSMPADADFTFVFLTQGPKAEIAPGDLQELIDAHVAYRRQLTAKGDLLLAGTFGPPRAEPADRGFLILDTTDLDNAARIASQDPAVHAGVFTPAVFPWRGSETLREVARRERAYVQSMSIDAGVENLLRGYVLASHADDDATRAKLAELRSAGHAAFAGTFGGDRSGEVVAALIAADDAEARTLLGDTTGWSLRPWVDSIVLQEL